MLRAPIALIDASGRVPSAAGPHTGDCGGVRPAASGRRDQDSGCRRRVVHCRPRMSAAGLLNLEVSYPAARSRGRPSLPDPMRPVATRQSGRLSPVQTQTATRESASLLGNLPALEPSPKALGGRPLRAWLKVGDRFEGVRREDRPNPQTTARRPGSQHVTAMKRRTQPLTDQLGSARDEEGRLLELDD